MSLGFNTRERPAGWRRSLARELSRQSRLGVREILAQQPPAAGSAFRIGVTGPPGAGKSSLIAALGASRLKQGREVGVLAIDPTSPLSRGSLLGDRIRMDAIADDARLFIRSVPSGGCHDGLCRNVVGLLAAMERAGFDDVVLETVGVGQVSYEARKLVDALVLVLEPESGDTIQAMKAGILEVADIYVVNKADLPGAGRIAAELASVLHRSARADGWRPPVIQASARDGRGVAEIDQALAMHAQATCGPEHRGALGAARRRYQFEALVRQRFDEVQAEIGADPSDLAAAFDALVAKMALR
jgi:LAO/AO transport system kinase